MHISDWSSDVCSSDLDELAEKLDLNLKVYRARVGIAWMEARLGRLWERGADGLQRYNRLRKVEPMQRALEELGVRTWIAGLRRGQSRSRAGIDFLQLRDGRWKLHPLARSEEHTSELQSLMRISYAVFCLKKR